MVNLVPPMYARKLGFTPPDLPNATAWWRSDLGIALRTAGPDDFVTDWTDQIGGQILTQADVAKQPLYLPNELNGFAALRFDGNDDLIRLAAWAGGQIAQPLTVLIVYRKTTGTSFTDFLVDGPSSATVQNRIAIGPTDYMAAPNIAALSAAIDPGTFALAAIFDGATSLCYANGAPNIQANDPGNNGSDGLTIGAQGSGGGPVSADVFEVTFVAGALAAGDLNTWGAYVGDTFGIAWVDV